LENSNLYCCDAPCSAGKTRAIVEQAKHAAADDNQKILIVQPTKELIEKTIEEEVGKPGFPVERFHSDATTKVVANLTQHFRDTHSHGEIVFTTHAAMLRLGHVPMAGRWTVYVDEVPSDYVKIEELRLPELDTRATFFRHFEMRDGLLLPGDGADAHPEKLAKNEKRDAVWKVYQGVASRVVSDHWRVHCEINEEGTLRTTSVLLPSLFKGFGKTVMASANFHEKILVKSWERKEGVTFIPDNSLALRFSSHENCERLTIRYVFDRDGWSKAFRDSCVKVEDENVNVGKFALAAVKQHVGDNPILVMRNKDRAKDFKNWENAIILPGSPHGLNSYTDVDHFAAFSAINPDPAHLKFLNDILGVATEEVHNDMYREVIYQGLFRSNLRIPDSKEPVECLVMDRGTADWLATKLPGCRVEPMDAPVEFADEALGVALAARLKKKRGPQPTGAARSAAERKAAQRARQKAAKQ